jgi:hypothetical protein
METGYKLSLKGTPLKVGNLETIASQNVRSVVARAVEYAGAINRTELKLQGLYTEAYQGESA